MADYMIEPGMNPRRAIITAAQLEALRACDAAIKPHQDAYNAAIKPHRDAYLAACAREFARQYIAQEAAK